MIPGYNPGPSRSEKQRIHLRSQMAVALGVEQQDLVKVDHDTASALGLGDASLAAKRGAIVREVQKQARADARAGDPGDARAAINRAVKTVLGPDCNHG